VKGHFIALVVVFGIAGSAGCAGSDEERGAEPTVAAPQGREQNGMRPLVRGELIDVAGLEGRIVFDDFEDVYVMDADGTNVRPVADRRGPEFDAAWAPDGRWIVYRDSRRGINENDEIYVARAAGQVRGISPATPPTTGGRIGRRMDARSCSTPTVTAL
jgi:hypothetical protein